MFVCYEVKVRDFSRFFSSEVIGPPGNVRRSPLNSCYLNSEIRIDVFLCAIVEMLVHEIAV